MASNQEKAQAMLNRFVTAKDQEKKKPRERRPFLASKCLARNQEKAQSMLNRYVTAKDQEKIKPRDRRPFLASKCLARNQEKAQSMLNRYVTAKDQEKIKPRDRRPFLASEWRDLADADNWRQQIMREIGRKVAETQNEDLGEHLLRDLTDEINKLIREKSHWERRIVELGGHNYTPLR